MFTAANDRLVSGVGTLLKKSRNHYIVRLSGEMALRKSLLHKKCWWHYCSCQVCGEVCAGHREEVELTITCNWPFLLPIC